MRLTSVGEFNRLDDDLMDAEDALEVAEIMEDAEVNDFCEPELTVDEDMWK